MPHFWNGKCNLLKANKKKKIQNLSKFTTFASLYSHPAYGHALSALTWDEPDFHFWMGLDKHLVHIFVFFHTGLTRF